MNPIILWPKFDELQVQINELKNQVALQPMKDTWCGSNLTTAQAAALMFTDGVKKGEAYLGGVEWSDISSLGLDNAEVKAFVINDSIIQFEMTSSDTMPFAWFFNSAAGVWRSYMDCDKDQDGIYVLKCIISNGEKAYYWDEET